MNTASIEAMSTKEPSWRKRALLRCRDMAEKYALACLGSVVFVVIVVTLWVVPVVGSIVILCLIIVMEYVVSSRCPIYRGWFFPEDIDY